LRRVREYRSLDIDADAARRTLRALPVPPDRAVQLPWLRLHLFVRDVLAVPWGKNWPIVKREMVRCVELRRAMIQVGGGSTSSRSSRDLALPAPYRRNMNRRRFLLTSLAGAFAAPLAVEAQSAKVYRIGILGESDCTRPIRFGSPVSPPGIYRVRRTSGA
jgi:hypothetical protein